MSPEDVRHCTVVVIDALRASTTIAHALAAGATEVLPCAEVDEARDLAARRGRWAVLGGERGGVKIDGFDLGNSPREYTPETVGNRTVVFTTSNGTRALQRCRQAKRVLIGAFVNASAVVSELESEREIRLLCAGSDGKIAREDVLLAGMLTVDLSSRVDEPYALNDEAHLAADSWRQASDDVLDGIPLAQVLSDSRGAWNLRRIGLTDDIEAAARIDVLDVVPELNVLSWRIQSSTT
jgi:2-phosphosulfolactate phosphatase